MYLCACDCFSFPSFFLFFLSFFFFSFNLSKRNMSLGCTVAVVVINIQVAGCNGVWIVSAGSNHPRWCRSIRASSPRRRCRLPAKRRWADCCSCAAIEALDALITICTGYQQMMSLIKLFANKQHSTFLTTARKVNSLIQWLTGCSALPQVPLGSAKMLPSIHMGAHERVRLFAALLSGWLWKVAGRVSSLFADVVQGMKIYRK